MTERGLPPRFYVRGFYFVWRDDGTELGKKNARLMASRLSGQPIWDDSPIPKKPSAIREAHNLIFGRVFDKREPKQHLDWWIESCPSESPGVNRGNRRPNCNCSPTALSVFAIRGRVLATDRQIPAISTEYHQGDNWNG
jgi:hypothetical protein